MREEQGYAHHPNAITGGILSRRSFRRFHGLWEKRCPNEKREKAREKGTGKAEGRNFLSALGLNLICGTPQQQQIVHPLLPTRRPRSGLEVVF